MDKDTSRVYKKTKQKTFTLTFQKMLKEDLTVQITN